MKFRWNNIALGIVAIISVVATIKYHAALESVLATTFHPSPNRSADERTLGLITLALLCVTGVAIIKLITHKR